MTLLLNASVALLALVATALAILAFIGWTRNRTGRLAMLAIGFGIVAAAGIITAIGMFTSQTPVAMLTWQSLLLAAGLFVVYLAAVKR
ncbi:MAG: hypothetical protein AABY18_01025 [Candidatus Thermoplasmatota archaeon]